jgi:hypothetical protein
MTDRADSGRTNGTGWRGAGREPAVDRDPSDGDLARSEFQLWHVYDAGGPVLSLKVRYRDDAEVPDWRRGPDLAPALDRAGAHGWHAYDSEPGEAPGEHAILHLKRIVPR